MKKESKRKFALYIVVISVISAVILVISLQRDYYTINEMWNNKETLSGTLVKVIGYAQHSKVATTFEMCPEDNPCCSYAGATLLLVNEKLLDQYSVSHKSYPEDTIIIRGNETVGCFGNNCELICNPLKKGTLYIVSGILNLDGENMILELESFSDMS